MRVQIKTVLILSILLLVMQGPAVAGERAIIPSFHVPSLVTPFSFTMRDPFLPEIAGTVSLYLAMSPPGAAHTVTFFYRNQGSTTFTSIAMAYYDVSGANDYYTCDLFVPQGPIIEYYFRVIATGYDTTYVYGTDYSSSTTIFESTAQAGAFSFYAGPHTATPTVTPTSTPPMTPSATPDPTNTPNPATPTPPPTPTATVQVPTPTVTPTPWVTPTATPGGDGVALDLRINQDFFHPQDHFFLDLEIRYTLQQTIDLRLFVLLDVYGNFFFGSDHWRRWNQTLSWEPITLNAGGTTPLTYVILDFPWPDEEVPPSTQGVFFWTAMLDEGMTLIGNVDHVEFGWGA